MDEKNSINKNNINININPVINIGNQNEKNECEESLNFDAHIIEEYENIHFSYLRDELSQGKERYKLYSLDMFKKSIQKFLPDFIKYQHLYEKYIMNLIDYDMSKIVYEKAIEECFFNINSIYYFLKEIINKKEEILLEEKSMTKSSYNYLIHLSTIALLAEYKKYKALNEEKIIKSKIINNGL